MNPAPRILLFTGSGVGKTSIAIALVRSLRRCGGSNLAMSVVHALCTVAEGKK